MKSVAVALGASVVASLVCLPSSAAEALTTNVWQAVGGVWDGNWNDPNHWSQGAVPNAADQYVQFACENGKDYTVAVDGDYKIASGELPAAGAKTRTTFAGSGKITSVASAESYAWGYRELVLDGVALDFAGYINCCANLYVTNGASIVSEQLRSYDGTADMFVYDGCRVEAKEFKPRTTMHFYVYEGATVSFNTVTRFSSAKTRACVFHVDGGDVKIGTFNVCASTAGAVVTAGTLSIGTLSVLTTWSGALSLQGGTMTIGRCSTQTILNPDWFVFGAAEATLKLTAGSNYLLCKEGTLGANVKVVAIIPEGLEPAGYMILRGWRDDTLTATQREAVTLEGATSGWALNMDAGGHVVAWKRATVGAEGTADYYEWTGAANDGVFETPANWSNGTATVPTGYPSSTSIGARFGASDKTSISVAGCSVKGLAFTTRAIDSYTLTGSGQVTPNNKYIVSYSAVPQYFATTGRSTGNISFYSDGRAPLYIGSSTLARPVAFSKGGWYNTHVRGDVRVRTTDNSTSPFALNLLAPVAGVPFTRMTAVSGNVIITNNVDTPTFAATNAAFDVEQGATLVYKKFGDNVYQWTAVPSDFRINGTFDIQAAFVGGFDQTYGGSGVLKTAEIRPDATGDTVVRLADTLTLEPSQDWTTASGTAPTNTIRLAIPDGANPAIRLAADWTYGPGAGTTETSRDDRSLVFNYGTSLTVDAGGHRATFKDYVTGRGTLIATNGTVKLDYAAGTRTNYKVCNSGILEWTGSNTVASITVLPGGTLRPLAALPLVFPTSQGAATATLTGSILDVNRALLPETGWLTVLRAQKGVKGLPTMADEGLRCRVKNVGGYDELQVCERKGLSIILR